jgi:hypothetical protein
MTVSSVPGRPFFICTAVRNTSSAPRRTAARSAELNSCGFMSSISHSIFTTDSVPDSAPAATRVRSRCAGRWARLEILVPAPYPMLSTAIGGSAPYDRAYDETTSAPVGVTSSFGARHVDGYAREQRSVAGAGTG